MFEALVLAAAVGACCYWAGHRAGVQRERDRVAVDPHAGMTGGMGGMSGMAGMMGGDDPHAAGQEAPGPVREMDPETLREALANIDSYDEIVHIAENHYMRGQSMRDAGDADSAQQTLQIAEMAYVRALQLDDSDPNLRLDLGTVLQGLGEDARGKRELELAIVGYDALLADAPDDPDIITNQGTAYRRVGDPETAVAKFRDATEADPTHHQSRYNLGLVLLDDLKRPDEAVAAWEEYLEVAPKDDPGRKVVERQLQELTR